MRYFILVLAAIILCYSFSCISRGNNQKPANSRPEEPITILRPVPAVLNEETHSPVEATETKVKGRAGEPFEFKRAQFIDENHGWAMSHYALYRTIDAGKTWERLPQEPEQDAQFTTFFFANESHGWLIAVKRISTERYGLGNSSIIMVTDDGGRSWKLQTSFPNEVDISEIRFFDANEGLAVGAHVVDSGPPYSPYDEMLVLKTSNGGKEWNNTSEAAKAAVKNEYGIPNDSGHHVEWTSASSVFMLTRYGKVISTTDDGKTWKLLASFKDERPGGFVSSTGFYKLALDPQRRVRMVAAGIGDEGYWGDFVVDEDGKWTSHEIDLTPILDAVFLSDKDVLACGANLRPRNEKSNARLKDAGVILRSFDTGKSWQSIYRSKTYETFFFLTRVNDNEFYALSDIGTFLRFRLPQ
jgi:photosystem II stability/assembly factor-like uncharacterized protein